MKDSHMSGKSTQKFAHTSGYKPIKKHPPIHEKRDAIVTSFTKNMTNLKMETSSVRQAINQTAIESIMQSAARESVSSKGRMTDPVDNLHTMTEVLPQKIPVIVSQSFGDSIHISLFCFDNRSVGESYREAYKLNLKFRKMADEENDVVYSTEWEERQIYEIVYKTIFVDKTLNWRWNTLETSDNILTGDGEHNDFQICLQKLKKQIEMLQDKSEKIREKSTFPNSIFLKIVYRLRESLGMVYWLELRREPSGKEASERKDTTSTSTYTTHDPQCNQSLEMRSELSYLRENGTKSKFQWNPLNHNNEEPTKGDEGKNFEDLYLRSGSYNNDNGTPEEVRQWKESRKSNKLSFKRKSHTTSYLPRESISSGNDFSPEYDDSVTSLLIDEIGKDTTFTIEEKSLLTDYRDKKRDSKNFKIYQKGISDGESHGSFGIVTGNTWKELFNSQPPASSASKPVKEDKIFKDKEIHSTSIEASTTNNSILEVRKNNNIQNQSNSFNTKDENKSQALHTFQTGKLEFDTSSHVEKTVDMLWEELIQCNLRQKEQHSIIGDLQNRVSYLETILQGVQRNEKNTFTKASSKIEHSSAQKETQRTTRNKLEKLSPQIKQEILDQSFDIRLDLCEYIIPSRFLTEAEKAILCDRFGNDSWNLLYRASRDGFDASTFHEKCDFRPYTLTIVKPLHEKYIIGAYNPIPWKSPDPSPRSVLDNRITMFTFQNGTMKEVTLKKVSCLHSADLLPSFGDEEFVLVDRANIHTCYTTLFFQDKKGRFYCEDIEVFQIVRKEVPVPRMSDSRL